MTEAEARRWLAHDLKPRDDSTPTVEFADIQGLLWSGYGPLKEACFLLLRVTDAAAARAWLGAHGDSVTTDRATAPATCRRKRCISR